MGTRWLLIATLLLAAGCNDGGTVGDHSPPAAPRGVYTVTGDGEVFVHWLANTEGDVAGYRIYEAPCDAGGSCPYDRVGATSGTSFTVTGLTNGVTRYYAVAAFDHAGNESELSVEVLFDTPRPEGVGRVLTNYLADTLNAGYDFSAFAVRSVNHPLTDMFFGFNGGIYQMFVPDLNTDIQDAGYRTTLDAVDYAPTTGWSPSGSVELIIGHCYIVWTRDDNYAKFRVTDIRPASGSAAEVVFDWAYQEDPGNRELRAGKVKNGERGATRPIAWNP
ncbi:MAG TPA: fibronectin type III domain-containing protein [Candidatus Eisenbacteria bacterium]|nr:fibronectin type III domain-containing protein [Candidatus Eisenbacteria bacterium]